MQTFSHRPLSGYTALGVGGPATTLMVMAAGDTLSTLLPGVEGPLWVLGYGTNCLIADQGLPGTVVLNQSGRIQQLGPTRYKADSGANWDRFMQTLLQRQLWGLEFTSGIPGGVGAAITGNIAAYGHQVADRLVEVTLLDTTTGQTVVWERDQLQLTYRASALQRPEQQQLVVLDATFELASAPTGPLEYDSALRVAADLGLAPDTLVNRRRIILESRRRAGSLLIGGEPGQAGSFFKNPLVDPAQVDHILSFEETDIGREKLKHQTLVHGGDQARVPAALVLLAAGFQRGQQWGQVRLHPRQILKIENLGGATAQDIYTVVQLIIDTVQTKLNIKLEPEVRLLGNFAPPPSRL